MICSTISYSHCSGISYPIHITLSDNCAIKYWLIFGLRVHPSILVCILVLKAGIRNHKGQSPNRELVEAPCSCCAFLLHNSQERLLIFPCLSLNNQSKQIYHWLQHIWLYLSGYCRTVLFYLLRVDCCWSIYTNKSWIQSIPECKSHGQNPAIYNYWLFTQHCRNFLL